MSPGLHVAVFFFSALLTVGSGDEISVDLCKLPDGVFPDPDNCDVFIRCQSRVPDVEPCPDNLLFNPLKLTCDFSKTGNCSEPNDFDETSSPVQTNDVVCSEDGPNVYPIQSSCTEYYMCENDTAFKVKCPGDLLMNFDKLTCDYLENVDCDNISSPEDSAVEIKAVYEDDRELESETETSVTSSSLNTSSASAKTAVQIKSETDLDSEEIIGNTLSSDADQNISAMLEATENIISDSSVSENPENTSTVIHLDKNITSKNSMLKETTETKDEESTFSEVTPIRTYSDQDIAENTFALTSTSNIKDLDDKVISSTSDSHRERSNLEDTTMENNGRDIETFSDTTVTNLLSNAAHDYTSSESSERSLSLGDESVTAIQTSAKAISNSGSDIDIVNIFTTYSNNESQQLAASTNAVSTSNTFTTTVINDNLHTKAFSSGEAITSDSLSETLENVSTLDSEAEFTTKITEYLYKSTDTETTKSEVSLSASYELASEMDMTDNKTSVDNLTSVKTTETIVTDSNINDSRTHSSVLTSLESLDDIKNESSFQDTTKFQTVTETYSKIAPGRTLTTTQALMSSDPLTDNETTKITTSTFSETVKATPKYLINTTITTTEYTSMDSETIESTYHSDDQNEGYEVLTESIYERNLTLVPESNIFTDESTVRREYFASTQQTENSIVPKENTEISEINDISSEDMISNKQSSLSNELSTSSVVKQSESTSISHVINEVINTEAITASENISSGHITENSSGETYNFISSEPTSAVPTEIDNSTETGLNGETVSGMSHSRDLSKTSDSYLSSSPGTNKIFDKSGSSMESSQEHDSTITIHTNVYSTGEGSGSDSETQDNNSPLIINDLTSENIDQALTSTHLKLTTGNDFNVKSNLPTIQNTKVTEITSEETLSDLHDSTKSSTGEYPTTTDAFSGFTESGSKDLDMKISSLKIQLDETTEKIDLSSESDVTKVDQTYIDMYTNKTTLSLANSFSSEEFFTASTADLESLTNNFSTTQTSENLKLASSEIISSVSAISQITYADISSDLTSTLLHDGSEFTHMTATTEQLSTSEDYFDSSESISKNTRINSKETGLPSEINSSALSEESTNLSGTDNITSTPKETLSSDFSRMTSVRQSELTTQISETGMDFGRITVSTSGVTEPEDISSTKNKSTSTDISIDTLNYDTATELIHTASIEITNTASETILPSKVHTDPIGDSSQTLSKNTDIFETTSDSLGRENFTLPETTLKSSEVSENLKHVSTDPYTLQINSTESTTRINKIHVSEETSEASDNNSNINTAIVDIGDTSTTEEKITNMYKESWTSEATDLFENTSAVTVSSAIEITNETSESFSPETKEITTENNLISILDANTTIFDIISVTAVQSTISKATSTVNATDLNDETSSSDTSVVSSSNEPFADTLDKNEKINSTEYITSTKEMPVSISTEFISTKLNSKTPDTYETLEFTDRSFEERSPNSQTNLDILSRSTLNIKWPTKSNTDLQTVSSSSISYDESMTDITSSHVITRSAFKTSDITSTTSTTYNEVETVSENKFQSPDNLVTSTDILDESSSLSSLKVTSEVAANAITDTYHDITDGNILSISTKVPIYSSEIDSSRLNPTQMSVSSISESTIPSTVFKRETVSTKTETGVDLSNNSETESTDSINKIISTNAFSTKFDTEIAGESTTHTTGFSRIVATETGNHFPITATTHDRTNANDLINDRTTEKTPNISNTDSISITSKAFSEHTRKIDYIFSTTDSSVSQNTVTTHSNDISESDLDTMSTTERTVLITDTNEKITESNTDFTSVSITSRNREEETNSNEYSSTTYFPSDLRTETSHQSLNTDIDSENKEIASTDTSSVSQTTMTKAHSNISESDLDKISTTEMTVLINDTNERITETNTDFTSVSITSRNREEETNSNEYSSTTYFPSDLRTETSHQSLNTDIDSENKEIASTDTSSVSQTTMTKAHSNISESDLDKISTTEMTVLINDTNEIITETNTDFTSVSITSRNREEETNSNEYSSTTYFPSDLRTETSHQSLNTDIDSENKEIASTDTSSVSQTTVTKAHSNISESDLDKISTTEMTVLINDTNERITETNTDFTSVSITSRNREEETNSNEYSSTTYFPSDLRTETSHSSLNTEIDSENKEITSTDSQTIVTKTHSKEISESTLPLVSTIETTDLIINDTNKTTTKSIANVSITSRKITGNTESTEYQSTTYKPAAFRTETSSANPDAESELQRISSTDIPSESTTTVNQICITSEGNFPHPDDCNKFYRCTKGVPVQSSCVGIEHFDPVKRICTNPCSAKCDPNADCGTTESKTSAEESTSQTTSSKDISSTSEFYNTGTEETHSTTTNKISKWSSEETSTMTEYVSHSTLESTTEKFGTDSLTSDESPSSVADINATENVTEITSTDYISSTSPEKVTTSDSNVISSDIPIASTTVTYEVTPETQTEIMEVTSSTVQTSTETVHETYSGSSEFPVNTDITPESSGDGEDASSASTWITSTKCENGDCLSSKSPTSATLVPFRLCPRNDFLSRPNCSEYLDCTGKVPNKLVCPKGLQFNPSTRVCDWPSEAECGTLPKPLYEPTDLIKCPCKSCLIPSTRSCSHYYLCIGFTAYEKKCSSNLYFDRSRNTCNFAPLVDCSDLISTSTSTEIEATEKSTKASTTEISTSTTEASTKSSSFVCPSREGLFRYPGKCEMFYQCANWYPYVMHCAATTHFSEITQRCEYPCDAKCDLTLNCGSPSTAPPSDPRCSCINCRLPSPESCTKYIVCVNGRARIELCPWGKTFDAKRSTCDWAHNVACRSSAMCPERNGLFSHKDDCHKFVHCSNGIPYVKSCPSVLEFDPIKKRCEWPTGRCNNDLPLNTRDVNYKNVEQRKGWKCPKTFGYFSHDQDCNKFYHCSFGTPTLKECSPNLLYNPRYQTCDWKKKVRCNSNRHQKPRKCRVFDRHVVCSLDRMPRPHVLCKMYYDCTAGRACAKQCPIGLYFNNMTGVCDLPEKVKCLNADEEDYSLKELSLKCASGEHGRQVNPTNDSCFYRCRQGKVVSGCCSKGHVYNLHKDKCERRTKSLRI